VRAIANIVILACAAALLGASAHGADALQPPTPAPATDAEREAFVHDAEAHRLPAAIAEAAGAALSKGFHFDAFQKLPLPHAAAVSAAPSAAGTDAAIATTPVATMSYRIQVMDDQSQAMQIRVKAAENGQPTETATCEWMCWAPSVPATADNAGQAPRSDATAH
jgi:hypothetical protein